MLNPTRLDDVADLHVALTEATGIVTSLPSVDFYTTGRANSVASLIADGLSRTKAEATIVYAAENNNHAAEILRDAVTKKSRSAPSPRVQFLNTVIGKMSRAGRRPGLKSPNWDWPQSPRAWIARSLSKRSTASL